MLLFKNPVFTAYYSPNRVQENSYSFYNIETSNYSQEFRLRCDGLVVECLLLKLEIQFDPCLVQKLLSLQIYHSIKIGIETVDSLGTKGTIINCAMGKHKIRLPGWQLCAKPYSKQK